MSANPEKTRTSVAERLSGLEVRLQSASDNTELLRELRNGIDSLLNENGCTLAEIRQVLGEHFAAGGLREETLELVESMIERYEQEDIPTSVMDDVEAAAIDNPAPKLPAYDRFTADQGYAATAVIEDTIAPPAQVDRQVQVGSILRDRFVLLEKISGGSMGVVYKALDRRLAEAGSKQTSVAVKVLAPKLAANAQALRALQQEATKGRCLVHPNIVRFIDLDREDNLYFLVMEWLEGHTLSDILDSADSPTIDVAAAFRIVRQIGEALDYAHRCGIVHADIKPANIMMMQSGEAKLFDFGVARVRQEQDENEFDPGVLGAMTPAYSSMQVLTGEEPTPPDDVFSLGCLLYRLLAGYRVFGPRNAAEAAQEGMKPQRIKGLGDAQWRALAKSLSFSRVTRYATVREFLEALNAEDDVRPKPFVVSAPDRFTSDDFDRRRSRWPLLLTLLLFAGTAAGYYYGYLDPWIEKASQFLDMDLPQRGPTDSPRIQTDDGGPIEGADDSTPVSGELGEAPDSDGLVGERYTPFDNVGSAATDEVATETESPVDIDAAIGDEQVGGADQAAGQDLEDVAAGVQQDASDASAELEGPQPTAGVVGPDPMLVDFSSLPPPTEIVPFTPGGSAGSPVNIAIREDGPSVVVDFVRGSRLSMPMTLRLEEAGFSGNRSPWVARQFEISDGGLIYLPAGQSRGRVTITMASDPLREADQQSTLRLRDAEFANSELATIQLTLEDDDQRRFESGLPQNTVAFASSQVSIRESDPAVQIDLIRYNPSNSTHEVRYIVSDITATEGSDYFAPGSNRVSFGPGQRSARILVPLVQDSIAEGDEAFVVEFEQAPDVRAIDIYRRNVIMIRDDDPPSR